MVMKNKILVLGNNDITTDNMVSVLALTNKTKNNGLIINILHDLSEYGYYHTTVIDLSIGDIIKLANDFDQVIMLDQDKEMWSSPKVLLSTYKLMVQLEKLGINVEFRSNENIKSIAFFDKLITTKKGFCLYPWILKQQDFGYPTLCTRSDKKVTNDVKIDWQTNKEYISIREKMLNGDLLEDYCKSCYTYETHGIESSRIFETMEWASKLNLSSIDDLKNIKNPYYYEIRLSNKCNLACRSCKPEHSHLIDKEFKKIKFEYPGNEQNFAYFGFSNIDINSLTPATRVYVAGGEPTVNQELYRFMEECVGKNKTDFDFSIGTNGMIASKKLLNLCKKFNNLTFSVSIDGFGIVNDYLRWPSNFDTIVKNTKLLINEGHRVSFLAVPSIYNVTNLHLLFQFIDKEFPNTGIYLQVNHWPKKIQSPLNHPNTKLVLESLSIIKQTLLYYSDARSCKSTIDTLYNYYTNNPVCDYKVLSKFFSFNDLLDRNRNMKLGDYIPELEAARKYIT